MAGLSAEQFLSVLFLFPVTLGACPPLPEHTLAACPAEQRKLRWDV